MTALRPHLLPVALVLALAFAVRLLFWRWHEFQPLSGDEREYLAQAVTLLQQRQYVELPLMRPPLYTIALALGILAVDSQLQPLRLLQAGIGALIVVPLYASTWLLWRERGVALLAGALVALDAALAAATTTLLSETIFLTGMATALWLLVLAERADRRGHWLACGAGVLIGALILVRSVALPLAALALAWLALAHWRRTGRWRAAACLALALAGGTAGVVAPWTLRNLVTYGGVILVDTTGAENLWLDNEPAGREAAKAALYALGDDRLARQRLAGARGMAAITGDPARFAAKAWREARAFVALPAFDDLRTRRAIWVEPAEVALRLVLGDGLWLVVLCATLAGWWLAPRGTVALDLRWIAVPWAAYLLLTAILFHVEPRYRLPLAPLVAGHAAWALRHAWRIRDRRWLAVAPGVALALALTGAHRDYLGELRWLAPKHLALAQAEWALQRGDLPAARSAAQRALGHDARSAAARELLARHALLEGDPALARQWLDAALVAVPDHPLATVMRGVAARQQGDMATARRDLAAERATREDLQARLWPFMPRIAAPPPALAIGAGLDLGWIRGCFPAEPDGSRWTRGAAAVRLTRPAGTAWLVVELAAGRPGGTTATVAITADGVPLAHDQPGAHATRLVLPLPPGAAGPLVVGIHSDTRRPRDDDPASAEGRRLGVRLLRVAVVSEAPGR